MSKQHFFPGMVKPLSKSWKFTYYTTAERTGLEYVSENSFASAAEAKAAMRKFCGITKPGIYNTPTEPGFYWAQRLVEDSWFPVEVIESSGNLWVVLLGGYTTIKVKDLRWGPRLIPPA